MTYEEIVIDTCLDIQLVIAFALCLLILYGLYKFLNMFF